MGTSRMRKKGGKIGEHQTYIRGRARAMVVVISVVVESSCRRRRRRKEYSVQTYCLATQFLPLHLIYESGVIWLGRDGEPGKDQNRICR